MTRKTLRCGVFFSALAAIVGWATPAWADFGFPAVTALANNRRQSQLVHCGEQLWSELNMHNQSTERRTGPRWGQIVACAAEAGLIAFLTWPFWGDGLRGNFYATPPAMAIYGFLFLASCFLLLAGAAPAVAPRAAVVATVWSLPVMMLIKWVLILGGGWEWFHNRMGLGMEILGPVPNYVIDGAIFLGSLGVAYAVRRALPKRNAVPDDPLNGGPE